MNFIILISFILIIGSSIVAMFPKQTALYISNVNKYDLSSVPRRTVYMVYIGAILVLSVALIVLLQEVSLIDLELPEIGWITDIL